MTTDTRRVLLAIWGTVTTILAAGSLAGLVLTGSQAQAQIKQLQREQAATTASVRGAHRDLITCRDLDRMALQSSYGVTEDSDGGLGLDQAPVPLPPHCVNQ